MLASLQAQRAAEAAVTRLDEVELAAKLDPLTLLPGRGLMFDRIEQAIAQGKRRGTRLAVFFLDLDHFKRINDTLGHDIGDAVLKLVAARLEAVVREADTVSRHSGDEFLVLMSDIAQPDDARRIAEKMQAAVALPARLGGHSVDLSMSVGIAVFPEDGQDPAALVQHADAAMYAAKRRRRGSLALHGGDTGPRDAESGPPRRPERAELREALFQHLREANEQLVVAAMAQQRQEEASRDAHRQRTGLLAVVAHELRAPLNPIRTAAERLGSAVVDLEAQTRLRAIIVRQVAYMSRLVEDLLDGSLVGTARFRLDRHLIDLGDVLRASLEACASAMQARGQGVSVRLPEAPMMMHADPVRLVQVFTNLLDNASKYTPERGRVWLRATPGEGSVTVTVADDGIGIAPEALPHVFDLYVRGTRSLSLHSRGLGIGLAVVRELVEGHGGGVAAASAGPDLGSEVTVVLPMPGASRPVA